jgi:hypothetical protein
MGYAFLMEFNGTIQFVGELPEGAVMTPVRDILRTAYESCDFGDWEDPSGLIMHMMEYKSGDSGFAHLVNSLMETGWNLASCVGWEAYNGRGHISEGHHRLTAAILFGMDKIPTKPYGSGWGNISAHHDGWRNEKTPWVEF